MISSEFDADDMTDNLGEFSSSGQSVYVDSDNSILRESIKTSSADGKSSTGSNKSYGDNFLNNRLVYAAAGEEKLDDADDEEDE